MYEYSSASKHFLHLRHITVVNDHLCTDPISYESDNRIESSTIDILSCGLNNIL